VKALDVLEKVRAAGVIGAGGAAFLTHVKLNSTSEFVIVNDDECGITSTTVVSSVHPRLVPFLF
jgi:Na+-translocating ferredoxin:NAD+ oxidoreductase RnfC subunit